MGSQCASLRPGKTIVDCTLGGSGHARDIIERILPVGLLIGMDRDGDAISNARRVLKPNADHIRLFHGSFIHISECLSGLNIRGADGILADLGISFDQLDSSGRGFSFGKDEPLDMRMNGESGPTAGDIVNSMSEDELYKIFREYGEERWAGRIARGVAWSMRKEPIRTSGRLARIVCKAIPKKSTRGRIHPATRVFMALRIAVNNELDALKSFMQSAVDCLNPGGRLCVLSFHSLEDRIVKHSLKAMKKGCVCPVAFPECRCDHKQTVKVLTGKPLRASREEVAANPMSRGAKLRVAEKI